MPRDPLQPVPRTELAKVNQIAVAARRELGELVAGIKAKRDLVIEAEGLTKQAAADLAAALGGVPWTMDGATAHLNIADTDHKLLDVVRAADKTGIEPTTISIHEPNLETVFLELTGRALRD